MNLKKKIAQAALSLLLTMVSAPESFAHPGSDRGNHAGQGAGPAVSSPARSGGGPSGNFGAIVSPEAKVWKTDPVPGYRNFGEWVSCQRKSDGCSPAPVEIVPVFPPAIPVPTSVTPTSGKPSGNPTGTSTSGVPMT